MSQHTLGQYNGSSSVNAFDLVVDRIQAFMPFPEYRGNLILEREVGEKLYTKETFGVQTIETIKTQSAHKSL